MRSNATCTATNRYETNLLNTAEQAMEFLAEVGGAANLRWMQSLERMK